MLPPTAWIPFKKGLHGLPLHLRRHLESGVGEHRWCKIEIRNHFGDGRSRLNPTGINHHHWDAHAFLIRESFVPAAMFHVKISVVTRENNEGIFQSATRLQGLHNAPHPIIDRRKTAQLLHVFASLLPGLRGNTGREVLPRDITGPPIPPHVLYPLATLPFWFSFIGITPTERFGIPYIRAISRFMSRRGLEGFVHRLVGKH